MIPILNLVKVTLQFTAAPFGAELFERDLGYLDGSTFWFRRFPKFEAERNEEIILLRTAFFVICVDLFYENIFLLGCKLTWWKYRNELVSVEYFKIMKTNERKNYLNSANKSDGILRSGRGGIGNTAVAVFDELILETLLDSVEPIFQFEIILTQNLHLLSI